MIELGLAIAWRKPLFLFRGDFVGAPTAKTTRST